MSIPNMLSVFRIILIPIFVLTYLFYPQIWLPALVLIVSGITDVVDGYIARRFHMETQLGKVLDPAADKLTLASVCAALAVRHHELIVLAAIYFLKELLMLIGGMLLMKKGLTLSSSKWFGKASTFVFYLSMFLIIVVPNPSRMLIYILMGVTLFGVIFSFFMYMREYYKIKR